MTEKGAMLNQKTERLLNSEEKTEKFTNSQSKNTKIEDFFGFSGKKRQRETEKVENKETDSKDNSAIEVINLIDDSANSKNFDKKESYSTQIHRKNQKQNKSQTKSNKQNSIDSRSQDLNDTQVKKEKKNRNSCSICRIGGDLLLCDNCPKSFHLDCLKLKESEIPEGSWYCTNCIPIIERRTKKEISIEEIKKRKNEKRRLYRLKKKEELRKLKAGGIHINPSLSLANKLKNSLHKTLNFKGHIPVIPVISDEIQNKIIQESKKLEASLLVKLNANILSNSFNMKRSHQNNNLITNFMKESQMKEKSSESMLSNSLQKSNKMIESIDLTFDDSDGADTNRNKIPTEEEANKILATMTKKGSIDLAAMNELAASNPILYAKVNNLYISSLNSSLPKSAGIVKKLNIKYPIEDEELYSNPEIYNLNKDFFNKPKGRPCIIPNEYFSRIIKIADFVNTFHHKLEISEFRPEDLYNSLIYYNEEEIHFINELHMAFIQVILGRIKEMENEKIFEDMETDLILLKLAMDNNFKRDILKRTWPEVLRLIINSDYFKMMVTEDLKDFSRRLKLVNPKNYNLLSLEEKLMLLEYLLNTVIDSDLIKKTIEEDIKFRIELTREKNDIEIELKQNETRKREIDRQEKFTLPRQKVETISKRLQTLVEDNPQLSRVELTKLRRELEQEREKYKSIIKEAEEIDVVKNKINIRLEKIYNDIYQIPTINKKLLGRDGLKNEYYFYPWIYNKLYVKLFLNETSSSVDGKTNGTKNFEWREITTEDEINDLISKLSEKGVKEADLLNKIKKIYPKRLKVKPCNIQNQSKNEGEMDISNIEIKYDMIIDVENDVNNDIKSVMEWRNKILDKQLKTTRTGNTVSKKNIPNPSDLHSDYFDDVIKSFKSLEERISDYLYQDEKEWESFDIRQSWKAWLGYIRKIPEYAKSLLLFNEKFKSPYKINECKSKIIEDDEYDYGHVSIINADGSLDIYKTNPNRVIAPKVKFWSKDLESLEDYFIEYVNNILSFSSLILGIFMFDGVLNDLFRRREYYKRKEGGLGINDETESYGDNYNYKSNNFNSISNSNNSKKNNRVDLDEYYYQDINYRDVSINIFNEDFSRRSKRLQSNKNSNNINNNFGNINVNPNVIEKKKRNIEWNDDCYVCGDTGDLLCCEDCPNVSHLFCAGLKKEPETWRCEDCTFKLVNKRFTRTDINLYFNVNSNYVLDWDIK